MLITAAGSVLALATGSLPEWRREKFVCRPNSKGTYALTRGNSHKHLFIIQDPWDPISDPEHDKRANLYLEDLTGIGQAAEHPTPIHHGHSRGFVGHLPYHSRQRLLFF
jgi:hypothetical protein